jgi:hypothetical protein
MEDLRLRSFEVLKTSAAQTQPVNLSSTLASERFASNFTSNFSVTARYTTLVASSAGQLGRIAVTICRRVSLGSFPG